MGVGGKKGTRKIFLSNPPNFAHLPPPRFQLPYKVTFAFFGFFNFVCISLFSVTVESHFLPFCFVLFFDTSWSLPVWLSAPCLVPINMSLCSSSRCAVIWWRHGVFCSRIRLSSLLMGPLGGLRTTECDHFFATLPNPPTPAPPEKQDAPKGR